jgi:K+-sensing histidine kinase KdpD
MRIRVGVRFVAFRLREIIYRSITLDAKPISRQPILIWLIASQLLALASLFFWLFAAGISLMAFDSGVTREAWTFVLVVWSYPIWPAVFAIAAWIAYARKKDKLAGILTTLTFLPVLVLLPVIMLSSFFYSFRL